MNLRVYHIDTARGIAILLVVLGHCFQSAEEPMNKIILSFHMPLFFFLSGIFAKQVSMGELLVGVKMKAKRLLIPQITLSLTIVILKGFLWIIDGNSLAQFDFLSCFGFWFLPVLFLCSIYFLLLSAIMNLNVKWIRLCVTTIVFILALIIITKKPVSHNIAMDFLIKSPVAFLFFVCGSFLKDWALCPINNSEVKQGLFIIEMIPVLVVFALINTPVMMYANEYGSCHLFFVTSTLGIYLIVKLSKMLQFTTFLHEMGKLSIAVYVWNFLIIGFIMRILNRLMKYYDISNQTILTASTFCLSVFVIYIIASLTHKNIPFIYGQKKIKYD